MKFNVANGCSLVDFCQFRNASIDFVRCLTARKINVKIIIFTLLSLLPTFSGTVLAPFQTGGILALSNK